MFEEQADERPLAVVTGASSGIGRRIAVRLGGEGYSLMLVGRDTEALERVADEAARDVTALTVSADLREEAGLGSVTDIVARRSDGVDVLVHSAGVFSRSEITEASLEDYASVFDTNVRARFVLSRELAPLLVRRRGQVVFIGSSLSKEAKGGVGLYSASMHADRAMARALRDEVNDDGVRVLSVYLGRTDTRMQRQVHAAEDRPYEPEYLMDPETVAEAVVACLKLPRDAEVTELSMRPMRNMSETTGDGGSS